jgi:hypothetical protein
VYDAVTAPLFALTWRGWNETLVGTNLTLTTKVWALADLSAAAAMLSEVRLWFGSVASKVCQPPPHWLSAIAQVALPCKAFGRPGALCSSWWRWRTCQR